MGHNGPGRQPGDNLVEGMEFAQPRSHTQQGKAAIIRTDKESGLPIAVDVEDDQISSESLEDLLSFQPAELNGLPRAPAPARSAARPARRAVAPGVECSPFDTGEFDAAFRTCIGPVDDLKAARMASAKAVAAAAPLAPVPAPNPTSAAADAVHERINALDIKAAMLLKQGNVGLFNTVRSENPEWEPNLHGIILEGKNLTGVNFLKCDLSDAKLKGANMFSASMIQAELEGADMEGANLSNSQLSGAKLSRVNLKGATMVQTNLCHADLTAANLGGAQLRKADFTGATLAWATMDDKTEMAGALFEGADMLGVTGLAAAQLAKAACFHLAKALDPKVLTAALEILVDAARTIISAQK